MDFAGGHGSGSQAHKSKRDVSAYWKDPENKDGTEESLFPSILLGDRVLDSVTGLVGTVVDFLKGIVIVEMDNAGEVEVPVGDVHKRLTVVSDLPNLAAEGREYLREQSLFQTLVIRPLVRSILGAMGLLTTEEQIDSFIGSIIRTFLPVAKREDISDSFKTQGVYNSLNGVQVGGGRLLRTWNILIQMSIDVGVSAIKVQSVIDSIFGHLLPDHDAELVAQSVRDSDYTTFVAILGSLNDS